MSAARKRNSGTGASGVTSTQQSAAEFFSEHQQIAGFDNLGKSLFTTIRELVENSLDAAETIRVLPIIKVIVSEYSEEEHNRRHGINTNHNISADTTQVLEDGTIDDDNTKKTKKRSGVGNSGGQKEIMYYDIQCIDNGSGIHPDHVGDLLGRVLSGSKHGIKQTRGKFGLGAKMALIWSKKSSGLPITIRTAYSTSISARPSHVSTIVLDMDIRKNEPRILSRKDVPMAIYLKNMNATSSDGESEVWNRGVDMTVTIAGSWSTTRSRVLQYFQQLAVITPYAHLSLQFISAKDSKKNFTAEFIRRSNQMPPPSETILPHARSVNNITLSHLLRPSSQLTSSQQSSSSQGSDSNSMIKFLTSSLSGIPTKTAVSIVATLKLQDTSPSDLSPSQVAALCQILRDEPTIRSPSASCLSPAGEYNLRLGVIKEIKPKLVATYTDKPGVHEGHPFLVEAAISLGGHSVKDGVNIFRFANRIPLLFETGADVVTQVATKRIKWNLYHIDPKKDAIGVYVSIVSTRIPFKGTSKEYIGDDVLEIQHSVKRALLGCCQQLRQLLHESLSKREMNEKRKLLVKYIPDISKSLTIVMQSICDKEQSSSVRSSEKERLFRLLEEQSSETSSSSIQSKKRKLSEKMLVTKLTERSKKISSESELLFQMDDEDENQKAKKKKSTHPIQAVPYDLAIDTTLVRNISVKNEVEAEKSPSSAIEGRWISIKGLDSGGAKIWIPSTIH